MIYVVQNVFRMFLLEFGDFVLDQDMLSGKENFVRNGTEKIQSRSALFPAEENGSIAGINTERA